MTIEASSGEDCASASPSGANFGSNLSQRGLNSENEEHEISDVLGNLNDPDSTSNVLDTSHNVVESNGSTTIEVDQPQITSSSSHSPSANSRQRLKIFSRKKDQNYLII